ncbi:hypothetical protein [Sphingosinicella microcystinivorans]|uniref:Uncharacterized protein n=1 Tax=Sphingosinicella microcystinivorans TaxID=335406 RepID=A0AAD1D9F5_SPHMI|nr:hypothetical protein [Sphingosinicella microcystinivorans]RKS88238.1 hypothetical protein DFR51_2886 [Sphingosinicella microcystinivorans]BBE36050.1 hypothetical protein SmB9_37080 [Sphingosinicella microcystinivorans]
MARDVSQMLGRADEALKRLGQTPEGRAAALRRTQRHAKSVAQRVANAAMAAAGLAVAALLFAMFVAPLGINGFLMLVLAVVGVGGWFLLRRPQAEMPTPQALKNADLAAIPRRVEAWLERQRRSLPARASKLIDEILLRLEVLGEQLGQVPSGQPIAGDARRLIGEHLPRLVDTYLKVPQAFRTPGSEPEAQLLEGLVTIADELRRLSEQLVRGDLDALAIEGKFLEQRYKENGNLP